RGHDEQRHDGQLRAHHLLGDRRGGHPGQEQQRVTGEEEADEQPGLGEDDGPDADEAEALDQLFGVEQATQAFAQGTRLLGGVHGSPGYRASFRPEPLVARCGWWPPRPRAGWPRAAPPRTPPCRPAVRTAAWTAAGTARPPR